jgi:ABC-type bacteriocin/lantibiotic exporter with double-glycine peptidase domain
MRNFFRLLGEHKGEYVAVVACTSILLGGEALIQPLLMKAVFDSVSTQHEFRSFIPLGLAYLTLGIVVNGLDYLSFVWRTKVDNKILSSVSTDLLRSFYSVPYDDLLAKGSGYYVARIRSDVKDGMAPMLAAVRDIVAGIVSFAMLISVLIYISLPAFTVLVLMIPICAAVSLLLSKRIRSLTDSERDYEAVIVDVLTRSIAALKIVRQFALIPSTTSHFTQSVDRGLGWSLKRARLVRLLQGAGDMTRVISDVGSIFVGAFLVMRNQMTIGSYIAFMNAFWRSSSTLFLVLNKWAEIHSYSSTIDRIAQFQRGRPWVEPYSIGDKVILRDIAFSYADTVVVSNISLEIRPGERVLVMGENGSGKTTLANILCGFLTPTEGSLTLPRRVIGATLPTHFPPTSVDSLGIDDDLLDRLGLGGEQMKATRPDFLSAGQQQKLAVAMALSTTADLYVLDEPFANLDMGSRQLMLSEILERTRGGMLVMIVHDAADYIEVFDRTVRIDRVHESRTTLVTT